MMKVVGLLLIAGIVLSAVVATAQMGENEAEKMKLTSPEFEHKGLIPSKFTCQGDDVNPTLIIEGLPDGAKSLALIVDDPDAPMGTWAHCKKCKRGQAPFLRTLP